MSNTKEQLFNPIGDLVEKVSEDKREDDGTVADEEDRPVQEIESLCMRCREQGMTRMMLTSIPYFREVIIMSFRCEHCGFSNNEIQSAGMIRPEGIVCTIRCLGREDLDRQVVKSDTCTVEIPEFELTIPPFRGQLTTVEGLLRDVIADLGSGQPLRRIENEAAYNKIQGIIDACKEVLADDEDENEDTNGTVLKASQKDAPMKPFTIRLDDPAGNSFIEFRGSMTDPRWNMRTYHRTREQNIALGLVNPDEESESPKAPETEEAEAGLEGDDEIYVFPGTCSSCGHPSDTKVKKTSIPYFKEILIYSTNCEKCGYRDNEVKSGSAISPQGKRITLKVEDREDLSRDVLKSETGGLAIPEIDLVLQTGTLGGRFTTLEGILDQIYEELSTKVFASGDSRNQNDAFDHFLRKLKAVKNVEHPFTVILDDPLANSYLQNLYAPDPDPNMEIVMYDRTWEQNEELGLNDMKVEGYEQDAANDANAAKPDAKAEEAKA
ncbi:zf-ZPR1-domain-containing protein [Obba rivulosa]|uniref:Zf-ZPR1-domain-containing protein n=1 Tax=Obba rivulosa TaxID=1052685 RepID=A0A8E2DQ79_9APHY|nr:zf-ZPR1-domain-containing protein [Obba rivulosa]